MKTELLDEYVFAELFNQYSEHVRNERIKIFLDNVAAVKEENLKESLDNLQWLRANT